MFEIDVHQLQIPSWSGYGVRYLPRSFSYLSSEISQSFISMNNECEERIKYTDGFRSVLTQVKVIRTASKTKKRLYASPSKSGHNFGMSLDVAIDESLSLLRQSEKKSLRDAGESRDSLAAYMQKFDWSGISNEDWHFNGPGFRNVTKAIDARYAAFFYLSAKDMQRCLNSLLVASLVEDGIIGKKTIAQVKAAKNMLSIEPEDEEITPWFCRLLSCATATLKISRRWSNGRDQV